MRRLVVLAVLSMPFLQVSFAQDRKPNSPGVSPLVVLSNDPCGNPAVESQLWFSVDGTVVRIIDSSRFVMQLTGKKEQIEVSIVGVKTSPGSLDEDAMKVVTSMLLNKPVDVLVNPDEWGFGKKHPDHAIGVVSSRVAPLEDIGMLLISRGLAEFKEPPPYKMSNYTRCRYQLAEKDAKSKHVGEWNGQN